MNTHPDRSRIMPYKGLSLIEILVAGTVLAVISVTVAAYAFDASERDQIQTTRLKLAELSKKIDRYDHDAGKLPLDLLPLTRADDGGPWLKAADLTDAWGNEILYNRGPEGEFEFELVSAGPDEADGTPDDIKMTF